jgi:large subunit ribosomal protein L17
MRHGVFGRKLNRDVKERRALLRSLVDALILHGKIITTSAKAKAVRGQIEKLVTHAKKGTRASLRTVESWTLHKVAYDILVKDIAPQFKTRPGGYIRIIPLGKRAGDGTNEVRIEWVEEIAKKQEVKKIKAKKETKKPVKKEVVKKAPETKKKEKAKAKK